MTIKVKNPILRGFNPDPSIIRVGNDYYLATSTFEWFPGVQIHHSTDLVNWKLIARPLNRIDQLDLLGVPDSCGVWAPCLSYDKGVFYLVYSNVKSFDGVWKDTPNYLVTTKDIAGEWSKPDFLSATGFDGSLFHDDDGKKWYLSMLVDHRKWKTFGGITLQEFNPEARHLEGPVHAIFDGSVLGLTEGPHLYKKDGYYYLITAEGGTEYGHAVSIARSENIVGPYELHPQNPIITCRNHPEHPLQKSGHGDLIQTPEGDWYCVFLVGRPLSKRGRCTLGRETAIAAIEWPERQWPVLKAGGNLPPLYFDAATTQKEWQQTFFDDFDKPELDIHFQSLRVPIGEDWCSLSERRGYLRIRGRASLSAFHHQSLIAHRIQHFHVEVSTKLDFSPISFQQMAGLVFYYNTCHFHYLYVSSQNGKRIINIITCDKHVFIEPLESPVYLPDTTPIFLKGVFNKDAISFFFATKKNQWKKVGGDLDGTILSDDYVRDEENRYRPAFTGSFVGLCCQDLTGGLIPADFDFFSYTELDPENEKN
ncbi:glycoside hydrolase family 43 protein [Fulvivirgaceae bacterium BMA12]|uniref:Glycoside hydrolase family 43 protein n=1 Tax=Agaribacillus aureus TaxID=3051825 RepID=A0ABT8LH23_9BACT|nr:glycoside hydrolase family 43 protein [Fulvivirgaceae bacterium BMA12]